MYAQRHRSPRFVVKGALQLLAEYVFESSQAVTVTEGSITIYDASGEKLVDSAPVEAIEGGAQYALNAELTAALEYGAELTEYWSLDIDGKVSTFRREAIIVKVELRPAITLQDLFEAHDVLIDVEAALQKKSPPRSLQVHLDTSFDQIVRLFIKSGKAPQLVINQWDLIDPHLALALHKVFMSQDTRLPTSDKLELADRYEKKFKAEWNGLKLEKREDSSERQDDKEKEPPRGSRFIEVESDRWS